MAIETGSIYALALMLVVLTALQGLMVPLVQGFGWGLGSRDESREQSALQGRFDRTVRNHMEAMLMYVPLMGIAIARGIETPMTELAAWLMIGARAAFIPLYLGGTFAARSMAYGVGMIAILILAMQLL